MGATFENRTRSRPPRLKLGLRARAAADRALQQARRQIDAAETRLMEAVESISEGFVQFDRDDRLVLCNSKFIELLSGAGDIREIVRPGVSFDEICRWTVERGLIDAEDGDPEIWLRSRIDRHRHPSDPIVVRLADARWLQIREHRTEDGGVVGIYADITEIKRDEQRRHAEALAEKSQLLQSTLDNLAQGVSVFDRELRLVAWNDRFLDLLELPEWLVKSGARYDDYLRYRSLRGDFNESPEVAVQMRVEEARRCKPAKRLQPLPGGKILDVRRDPMPGGGFVTTYTDVTERQQAALALRESKEYLERRVAERTSELTSLNEKLRQEIFERALVEEALRHAKAEAERANMSKTRFLAAASHDLLQPLHAARLFVAALSERPLGDPELGFVRNVDQALGGVETLLGSLLDISKLDAGVVAAERSDFVAGELMLTLADEFSPLARESGLRLTVVPSSQTIRSDPALLSRVLRNFLSNAIRYTPYGRVLLGARRRGERLRIEVCDTGVGIPPEATAEIFEEFRQLHARVRGRDPGHDRSCGLGLAIVKRIARVLEHTVGLRSTPGRGSTFFIECPLGARATALPRGMERARGRAAPPAGLVLVIDDEPAILDGMAALLGGWGCEVITASGVAAALATLADRSRTPDLVIADYHLADGETGIAALDAIRAAYGCAAPAIVITADRSSRVQDLIRSHGLRALKKPVKPAKLRALIAHLTAQGAA